MTTRLVQLREFYVSGAQEFKRPTYVNPALVEQVLQGSQQARARVLFSGRAQPIVVDGTPDQVAELLGWQRPT